MNYLTKWKNNKTNYNHHYYLKYKIEGDKNKHKITDWHYKNMKRSYTEGNMLYIMIKNFFWDKADVKTKIKKEKKTIVKSLSPLKLRRRKIENSEKEDT